jgi:MFS family permease
MFSAYRSVFRAPGSLAFATAGFVMRMPIAMFPIGLVLIISARTGRYGFAGVLSAAYVIGAAVGNPLLARWSDRFGQRRMILPATAVTLGTVAVLVALLKTDAPDGVLLVPGFVTGFSYLSVGSLIRARWSLVLAGKPELTTAYALESVLDEVIFVVGPLIATLVATHSDPLNVLYVAGVLIAVGAIWLSVQRSTEPPVQAPGGPAHASALRAPGVRLVVVATIAMGALFASAEVTMVAYCGQHGQRGLSGLMLALLAGGSASAGLVYGARSWRRGILERYRLQSTIFAVLPVLFLAAVNVSVLAVCAFIVGLGIAPTLITTFGLVEQLVPAAALTEGLAWVITGLSIGYGAGSALVGGIADAHGARVAFSVTIAAALVMGAVANVLYRRLATAPTADPQLLSTKG